MELFDLYDRENKLINKTLIRGNKTLKGEYHKVVHIWIENSQGEYLVQQRNKTTDTYPYQWAPTAGSCIAGELPFQTAIRETKEELGLVLQPDKLKHLKRIFVENSRSNFIIEVYKIKQDVDLETLVLDYNEVKAVAYFSETKIIELITKKRFWDFIQDLPDINYFDILRKE